MELRVINRNLRRVNLYNALDLHMEYPGWNELTALGDVVVRTNTPLPLAPSGAGAGEAGAGTDPADRWLLDSPADNALWLQQQGRLRSRQMSRLLERRKKCGRRGKESGHRWQSLFSLLQAPPGGSV